MADVKKIATRDGKDNSLYEGVVEFFKTRDMSRISGRIEEPTIDGM